jgi:hypothetical protein
MLPSRVRQSRRLAETELLRQARPEVRRPGTELNPFIEIHPLNETNPFDPCAGRSGNEAPGNLAHLRSYRQRAAARKG